MNKYVKQLEDMQFKCICNRIGKFYWVVLAKDYAALQQQLEAAERMAQEHGWPGYSQGGNPVSYLYNELIDAKQQLEQAQGEINRGIEEYVALANRFRDVLKCYEMPADRLPAIVQQALDRAEHAEARVKLVEHFVSMKHIGETPTERLIRYEHFLISFCNADWCAATIRQMNQPAAEPTGREEER